jgi:hypothetical protein
MENLAMTCKILYDREFLQNQKLFKGGFSHKKVLYDNYSEYQTLCEEFNKNLPITIRNIGLDDWSKIYNSRNCLSVIKFEKIEKCINKLTKDHIKIKVNKICSIIYHNIDIIISMFGTVNLDVRSSYDIECSECGNTDELDVESIDNPIKTREYLNNLFTGLIKNLIFSNHTGVTGLIEELIQFKCVKCEMYKDMIYEKDICYKCCKSP